MDAYRAIAEPIRRVILQVIARQSLTVGELVRVLGQPQSTVSRHLRALREAGLVANRRNGASVVYAVASEGDGVGGGASRRLVARLVGWLAEEPLPAEVQARLAEVLEDRSRRAREVFERVAGRWEEYRVRSFGPTFALEAVLGLLPAHWTVADLGAGTGDVAAVMARHVRRVVAVDPSPQMVARAKERFAGEGLGNAEARVGTMESLPLESASVDVALVVLALHHVAAPERAIGEIARVVKRGGRVVIVEQVRHRLEKFYRRMGDLHWGFDPGEVAGWLECAGFSEVIHRPLPARSQWRDMPVPALFALYARRDDREANRAGGSDGAARVRQGE